MNDFELKELCEKPLRKQAYGWKDFGRQAVFTGAGAGTGALVNHLLGNRTLSSYLIGGGIGALGGLGLERVLNAGKKDSFADEQIDKIEAALGRSLTDDERAAVQHTFNGPGFQGTGIGALTGIGLNILSRGGDAALDSSTKKFTDQLVGGEKQLKRLTHEYIRSNPNDPLVKQYNGLNGAAQKQQRRIVRDKITEQVAGMNRNYTPSGILDPVARWAYKPTKPGVVHTPTRLVKGAIRMAPRGVVKFAVPTLLGFLFDTVPYAWDAKTTGWLELKRALSR